MKSLFTTMLLVGFLGVTVFGVFNMHTGMQNHDSNCVAATAQGVNCPKQGGLLEYLTFHLDAYKGFSLAAFGENTSGALSLVFVLLLFIGLAFSSSLHCRPTQFNVCRYRFKEFFSPPQKQELTRWLALHENSPAAF